MNNSRVVRDICDIKLTHDICSICDKVKFVYNDICPKCRGWKLKRFGGTQVYVGDDICS
jgi:hypothetical protein